VKKFKLVEKYEFELIPGDEKLITGEKGVVSYYHYVNSEPYETGKNLIGIEWLTADLPKGLTLCDPFAGCGLFAFVVNKTIEPSKLWLCEIDEECFNQLTHAFRDVENAKIFMADAKEMFASPSYPRADIYLCDFPRFTLRRHQTEQRWAPELKQMFAANPRAIIMSDGSSHLNHFVQNAFRKVGIDTGKGREDFARYASRYLHETYGYSITMCAYHGNCFYYRLEKTEPGEIKFNFIKAGSWKKGLNKL
jgi:hypothetical protein